MYYLPVVVMVGVMCYAMVALGDVGWRMAEIAAGRGTEHRQTESFLRAWVGDRQKLQGISTNRLFVNFNGRQADELKGMMLSNSSVRHLCADLIW